MRRTWEWLGLNLGKHAGIVACIGLAITIVLGMGLSSVKLSTGDSDYLNADNPLAIGNQKYTTLFGGDPIAVLFTMKPGTSVDDLLTPANQAEMQRVDEELERNRAIFNVVSPLTALNFASTVQGGHNLTEQMFISAYQRDRSARSRAVREAYAVAEARQLSAIPPSQRVVSNPKWIHFVLHEPDGSLRTEVKGFVPDERHVLMAVFLKPNLDFNQELAAAASVERITASAHYKYATTITTGVPEIEKDVNDYVRSALRTLILLAAILMAVILVVAFRVRWRLLPFAVLGVGMIWAFGLVGYFGIPLTFATLTAIPVLMGVGMDYSIQMHARIEEEVRVNRTGHPIQAAARGLGPALLIVTFDAVFAFAALWFSEVPAVRQFGSLMVIGIIAVCLCSLMLTLAILGIREYRSPTPRVDQGTGALGRVAVRLSGLSSRVALPLIAAAAVVFAAGVVFEGRLVIQPDPIKWLDPHSTAVRQIDTLEAVTGSDNQIGIVVQSDHPFSAQTVNYVSKLTETEARKYGRVLYPGAGVVSSADDFLTIPGADFVPPTAAQVKQFYQLAPAQLKKTLVHGDALNVILLSRTNNFTALEPVIDNLQHDAPPPRGTTAEPGGIGVVSVGLLDNLAKTRALLTYLALAFVAAFLAIRLRSVIRSLISLIPVLIAVGGVTLAALAFNVTLSPLTAVSGPLVVAVCTEFTSLILLRFVEERNRGRSPRQAMTVTANRTGRAFLVSALTVVAGIVVVATSPMPMLRDFGIVMALNVSVALLSALVVLPPVLVWAEASHGWISRGLLRPVPETFEFEDGHPSASAEPDTTASGQPADTSREVASGEKVPGREAVR